VVRAEAPDDVAQWQFQAIFEINYPGAVLIAPDNRHLTSTGSEIDAVDCYSIASRVMAGR
jgi:hypothetical protein